MTSFELNTHLFITQPSHLVNKLLLNHEGSQVSSVTGQEDDSKESPDRHHDFTRRPLGVLHRHRVVEDQAPQ